MGVDYSWENKKVVEIRSFIGSRHVGFSTDFQDATFFDRDAAIDDFLPEVSFHVIQYGVYCQVKRTSSTENERGSLFIL